MILFIKFLIAHFVGDFLLQARKTLHDKQHEKIKSKHLYLHVLIHGVLTFAITMSTEYWKGIAIFVATHLLIDIWKLYNQDQEDKRAVFITDQIMHILVIIVITNWYSPWIASIIQGTDSNHFMLFILAILLITTVSSHLIKVIISKWQPENEDVDEDSLTNAGSYIGILERLFVFGFKLSGNLQGIGSLLAAKSVFRFGDLKDSIDRKLTEYILIGTLLSFGFVILIGHLYLNIKSVL